MIYFIWYIISEIILIILMKKTDMKNESIGELTLTISMSLIPLIRETLVMPSILATWIKS